MDLDKNQMILGFTWLQKHNSEINWEHSTVKITCCLQSYYLLQKKTTFLWCLENKKQKVAWNASKVWSTLDTSPIASSEKLAAELVLQSLHRFLHIFQKHESECMPTQKPWDHGINLKDIFKVKKGRLIPLLLQEQEEVSAFINEQLCKGYIHPFKFPKISPGFLISKKDRKKWMV